MTRHFKVNGTKKLAAKLKRNASLVDVKKVVRLNGSEMQRKAKRSVPVDTGFLKRSIVLTFEDNGFTAKVSPTAHYAPYVNYGTRFMYAQPFMTSSFYSQRQKFIDDLKRLMH